MKTEYFQDRFRRAQNFVIPGGLIVQVRQDICVGKFRAPKIHWVGYWHTGVNDTKAEYFCDAVYAACKKFKEWQKDSGKSAKKILEKNDRH